MPLTLEISLTRGTNFIPWTLLQRSPVQHIVHSLSFLSHVGLQSLDFLHLFLISALSLLTFVSQDYKNDTHCKVTAETLYFTGLNFQGFRDYPIPLISNDNNDMIFFSLSFIPEYFHSFWIFHYIFNKHTKVLKLYSKANKEITKHHFTEEHTKTRFSKMFTSSSFLQVSILVQSLFFFPFEQV